MFDATEEWRVGSLGDLIVEVSERIDPSQATGGRGRYVGLEHIGQGTGGLTGCGLAADVVSQKSVFQRGDILYGKLRPNLCKVARPEFGGVCSTDIIVFRAKDGADADFAFQLLQSRPLLEHAVATAAGTKMPRTHARSILSFETLLPPLEEQRRIAEVLRSVDAARANNERASVVADKLARANLMQAFVDVADEGTGRPLESLLKKIIDYRGVPPPKAENGIPLITAKNVRFGYLDPEPREFIAEQDYDAWMRRGIPSAGDILFTTEAPLGFVAEFPDYKAALGQRTITLVADPEQVERTYLKWLLISPPVQDLVHRHATGSTAKGIKQSTFRKLRVNVPPLVEQREIAATCESVWRVLTGTRAAAAHLRTVKEQLADDLLFGRVRVPA